MNTLEARRRLLGRNVYKRTTEGNQAIAQGSLARMYPGIEMQGRTEQAQYEGKNLFNLVDLLSLIPENGSDMVNVVLNVTGLKPNTAYTLSAAIEGDIGGDYTNRCLYIGSTNTTDSVFVGHPVSKSSGDGGEITVYFYPFRDISQGIKSGSGNVQLEEGTVATTYEPYTGGEPSPSPDYPQKIVSAGKYNEETGKWEYEITIANEQTDPDKNQTILITSDRPLTKWDRLEKRNGQWGWVYKSAEIVLDGSEDETWGNYSNFNGFLCSMVLDTIYTRTAGMCNQGVVDQDGGIGTPNTIWLGGNTATVYFINNSYYNSDLEDEGLQDLKNHLAQSPAIIWYETAAETFAPLSAAEQEAMNALHTFRPTTVLSNNCGCNMTLTYKTKKSMEVTT